MHNNSKAKLEKILAETKESWSTLKKNGIDEKMLLNLNLFHYSTSKKSAELYRKFILEEKRLQARINSNKQSRHKTTHLIITTDPMYLSLDILMQIITYHFNTGAGHDCEFGGWSAKVPFEGNIMDLESMKSLVNAHLNDIPNLNRKEELKKYLVEPRLEMRDWNYRRPSNKLPSWTVAECKTRDLAIVFCIYGFGPLLSIRMHLGQLGRKLVDFLTELALGR
ncbi:MAG: hypothetical protein JW860_03300 [Sedimentisphaerales bacterium]|nr:hypothetical protein [Sedimentisphaerales bacterium]